MHSDADEVEEAMSPNLVGEGRLLRAGGSEDRSNRILGGWVGGGGGPYIPLKGSLKGFYKGSIIEFYSRGLHN